MESTQVKPGYQVTELGVIPEEWDITILSELIENLEAGTSVNSVSEELKKYSHPESILKTSCVFNGYFYPQESKKIAPKDLNRAKLKVKANTIIISRMNTPALVGECGYVSKGYDFLYLPDRLWMTKFKTSSFLNVRWLAYILSFEQYAKAIKEMASGTSGSMKNISKDALLRLNIPLPPLPEQKSIAAALSDVDALITAQEALIAKKRDIKTATMQQLLTGKVRLGQFKEEWKIFKVIDFAENKRELFNDGDWIESEFITSNGVRLIQTGNIGIGTFIEKTNKKYISNESFNKLNCKQVFSGDVLICRLAEPAGRSCIVPELHESKMITSVDVTIFRPVKELALKEYLVQFFSTSNWFKMVEEKCGGSTRTRIARGQLGQLKIKVPPIPEQKAIAEVLSDMDAEITALEAQRDKTRAIKQGMMQELLTGKTRLI